MASDLRDRLRPCGRMFHATKAIRIYRNGDGLGFIWRWWHPLSWCAAPALFMFAAAIEGFPAAWREREDLGLRVSPFFKRQGLDPFGEHRNSRAAAEKGGGE